MSLMPGLMATANDVASLTAGIIPDPAPQQPPNTGGVSTLLAWLKWGGYAVVAGAIIIGGAFIAVGTRHGEGQDAFKRILFPCLGAIIIGGGVGIVSQLIGG